MSKKVLNIDGITNELEGASLFFSKSTNPLPPSKSKPDGMQSPESGLSSAPQVIDKPSLDTTALDNFTVQKVKKGSNEETIEPTNERLIQRSTVRKKIRHTFDIFADQLMSLRELSIEQEKTFGDRVLLGDLAQQALDQFISKQRNK